MGKVKLVSCLLIKFKASSQIPHECPLSLDSGIFSILEDLLVSPFCVCKRITDIQGAFHHLLSMPARYLCESFPHRSLLSL